MDNYHGYFIWIYREIWYGFSAVNSAWLLDFNILTSYKDAVLRFTEGSTTVSDSEENFSLPFATTGTPFSSEIQPLCLKDNRIFLWWYFYFFGPWASDRPVMMRMCDLLFAELSEPSLPCLWWHPSVSETRDQWKETWAQSANSPANCPHHHHNSAHCNFYFVDFANIRFKKKV